MSKIERLNARVAKLLTVAMDEILEVVRETALEYQEKTARTQRENESLKRRVQELQDKLMKANSVPGPLQAAALHVVADQDSAEQWQNSSHRQGTELIVIEEKREAPEDLGTTQMEEELGPMDSDTMTETDFTVTDPERSDVSSQCVSQTSDTDPSMSGSHSKSGPDSESVHTVNVPGRLSPGTVGFGGESGFFHDEIKIEAESPDHVTPQRHAAQSPFHEHTDGTQMTQKETSNDIVQDSVGLVPYAHFQSNYNPASKGLLFKNGRPTLDGRTQKQYCRKDEEHRCILCGKTFSRIGNLRIHQRCHTGEKPYCCTQCGRCFSQAGDLKKHKRVHTGEKPYYCTLCGKSFSRGENLKRHQKIHYGDALHLHQFWREQQSNAML